MKRTILSLDPVKHEPVIREMTADERPLYYFGEDVGILTVSQDQLTAHQGAIFVGCDIDDSIPLEIAGMNESEDADIWLTQVTPQFDRDKVQAAVVNTALRLKQDYPDLGAIILECTEMPPYSQAILSATGLPVFDPVDMIKRVHQSVCA